MANEQDNKQLSWGNPQNAPHKGANQQPPATPPAPQAPKSAPSPKATPAMPAMSGSAAKVAGWLAVGVVAGVVVAWAATGALRQSPTGTTAQNNNSAGATSTAAGAQASSSLLTVLSPQKAGTSVAVSGVNVAAPTWVVVYESRNGTPGNVLGASLFFPGGSSGTVELLRGTVAGQTYFVTERKDNGDRQFSLTKDTLMLGADGQPSWTTFNAD